MDMNQGAQYVPKSIRIEGECFVSIPDFRPPIRAAALLLLTCTLTLFGFAQNWPGKGRYIALPPQYTDGATRLASSGSTLPNFTASYSFLGHSFSYTMVGTDPFLGSATTTVPTFIIPVKLVFSGGIVRDPHQVIPGSSPAQTSLADTLVSPIFKSLIWKSGGTTVGTTQYGDAFQRASFWNFVSTTSPNYHVLLGTPTVLSTLVVNVPAADGIGSSDPFNNGVIVGLVDINFLNKQFLN